jgi:tubulin---tyrosine ligase
MGAARVLQRLRRHLCPNNGPSPRRVPSSCATGPRANSTAHTTTSLSAPDLDYVLLVNDDGPPDPEHSPFIETFASHLSHWAPLGRLAVCLPATQQSWRGKAHAPYESLTATALEAPATQRGWVLVTGTPAAAANYGVHHVGPTQFSKKVSPDALPLVVSGPNLGDNSGRSFMLSSGTLGAALEASLSGHRAVAVSFRRPKWVAKGSQMDASEAAQVEIASAAVCRLLTRLWSTWPAAGVDLYVPRRPCTNIDLILKKWAATRVAG